MTREEIIRMAREAGLMSFKYPALIAEPDWEATERFAALVAAAERKRFAWTQEHWTEYERNIAAAAKAEEREACAKVCEGRIGGPVKSNDWWTGFKLAKQQCAAAIRARSTK